MSLYDFNLVTIDGRRTTLQPFRGRVLLVVNVASRCGFTPQYAGLEALYRAHHDRGFSVLGFPCDQFGHQEPGAETEISAFCEREYAVTFPMFAKIEVNGPRAHPLYRVLKRARRGMFWTTSIKWNFTKFLIGSDGQVISRHAPRTRPQDLEEAIVRAVIARSSEAIHPRL